MTGVAAPALRIEWLHGEKGDQPASSARCPIQSAHVTNMQGTCCCVRRGKDLAYDPGRVDTGVHAPRLSYTDVYFENKPEEDSAALVLDNLLAALPERQRAAIDMCIIGQISYAQAGRMMGCSDQTMRRETIRAIKALRSQIEDVPWLAAILDRSYLPVDGLGGTELPEVR